MRKSYLLGGVVIVAVAVLALPMLFQGQVSDVAAQDVQTAQVERTSLNTSIESTGTIAAEQTIYLSFGTSGTVNNVEVEVGDAVTAGQVIANLSASTLEYQVALKEQAMIVQQTAYDQLVADPTAEEIAQAQANLASAQSQLESAQASLETAPNLTTINCSGLDNDRLELERAQDAYNNYVTDGYEWDATFIPDPDSAEGEALLNAQNALNVAQAQCNNTTPISEYEIKVSAAQASVDQAQAALDSLLSGPTDEEVASKQAQLEQARLELDNARAGLEDAVIAAPFAGVITVVNITSGQLVSTANQAITLVDNSQFHVDVTVDEEDIAQVGVGQAAIIAPGAFDTTIQGLVARVAPAGIETDGIVTYEVRVDLTDADSLPIKIGMTTDVEIVISSEADVLVVPTEAIQRTGQNEFVQLYNEDGSTVSVPITSGQTSDGLTVIDGDLTEGALVVIPAADQSTSGSSGLFGG